MRRFGGINADRGIGVGHTGWCELYVERSLYKAEPCSTKNYVMDKGILGSKGNQYGGKNNLSRRK